MSQSSFTIDGKPVGRGHPAFIVAEMSANHGKDLDRAIALVHAAKNAGADAIKIQTYTPDTITIDSKRPEFMLYNTAWNGRSLHELYDEAYMDWDWHRRLQEESKELDITFFSSPFDETAVAFLQDLDVPAYKIASFELVDHPLLACVAKTGRPVILSTGMATLGEIEEAVAVLRANGCRELALLKCTMALPAKPAEMNLCTIPHLAEAFDTVVGLSDHSMDLAVPVAAVSLGASIIEKHLTLRRADGGPDSTFSLEPEEFAAMVNAVRTAEAAVGKVSYGATASEEGNCRFRRSLYVVEEMAAGDEFTREKIKCVRPANGLAPRYYESTLGRKASRPIPKGTPLSWEYIE